MYRKYSLAGRLTRSTVCCCTLMVFIAWPNLGFAQPAKPPTEGNEKTHARKMAETAKQRAEKAFNAAFFPPVSKKRLDNQPASDGTKTPEQGTAHNATGSPPETKPTEVAFITLLTNDGQRQGAGGDMFVKLFRDRRMVVTYEGCFSVESYRGKFSFNDKGEIIIEEDGIAWPPSRWRNDGGQLVIEAPTKEAFFAKAREVGIAEELLKEEEAYDIGYGDWPLREYIPERKNEKRSSKSVSKTNR